MIQRLWKRLVCKHEPVKEMPVIQMEQYCLDSSIEGYHNFWKHRLPAKMSDGWKLIHIHDDKNCEHAVAIFERVKRNGWL